MNKYIKTVFICLNTILFYKVMTFDKTIFFKEIIAYKFYIHVILSVLFGLTITLLLFRKKTNNN
jgi:hypothetical protein